MSAPDRDANDTEFGKPMVPNESSLHEVEGDSLDPKDWDAFRHLAHEFLDRAIDGLQTLREQPVWREVPEAVRAALRAPLPYEPTGIEHTAQEALELIAPYATGNVHPRFFGWVHGSGTAGGILAAILTAAMNSNAGGRDHGVIYVERQVIDWCREIFGFPMGGSGILLSGTSMATALGLAVARQRVRDVDVRKCGVRAAPLLAVYASSEAHVSVAKGVDLLGLGQQAMRRIPTDADYRMDLAALRAAVADDRRSGTTPLCVVATAGTVNTGAFDDLEAIASFCEKEEIWLHIDGAFGAWVRLAPSLSHRVRGIERADSLAFDFHKWLHVPYDAGCLLVRCADAHLRAFQSHPDYLAGALRGLAGGQPWFCDFGPELSRCARAIKVWFTLREHGLRRLGEKIRDNCEQASYLAQRVSSHSQLALAAPLSCNIVCWRYLAPHLSAEEEDQLQLDLVADLQEAGIAAPSTTRLDGRTVIRVAITNHRTRNSDLDRLVDEALSMGRRRAAGLERSLESLLVSGGDSRLRVDPSTGLSRYGCSPSPSPLAIAVASTTASTISCDAFAHVETTRQALQLGVAQGNGIEAVARVADQVRQDILVLFQAPPGTDVLLTASGTEAELGAIFLALSTSQRKVRNIVLGPAETGTHSVMAAAGRHFDASSSLGNRVEKGALVDSFFAERVEVVGIGLRHDDGSLRPIEEVDREVEEAVEAGIALGQRVVLHVLDVSKTGLIAPRIETVVDLTRRHPNLVDVLVDACQLRLSPVTLHAYGKAGFLVMISGSKFLTGPPFAGALLVPAPIAARVTHMASLPSGLRAYFSRDQLPRAWQGIRDSCSATTNLGLLLRWQAALWEARRFAEVSNLEARSTLSRLSQEIDHAIAVRPHLGLVDTRDLQRGPFHTSDAWDVVRTIFTFTVSADDVRLSESELVLIHDWMNQDVARHLPADVAIHARRIASVGCHIGRPVCIAQHSKGEVAGLRVSASARLVSRAAFDTTLGASTLERLSRLLDDVRTVFEKLDLVIAYWAPLKASTASG